MCERDAPRLVNAVQFSNTPDARPTGQHFEMSECRLLERDGKWYFHVTASRVIDSLSASDTERTPVGRHRGCWLGHSVTL